MILIWMTVSNGVKHAVFELFGDVPVALDDHIVSVEFYDLIL